MPFHAFLSLSLLHVLILIDPELAFIHIFQDKIDVDVSSLTNSSLPFKFSVFFIDLAYFGLLVNCLIDALLDLLIKFASHQLDRLAVFAEIFPIVSRLLFLGIVCSQFERASILRKELGVDIVRLPQIFVNIVRCLLAR